jgi:hypothetical protein
MAYAKKEPLPLLEIWKQRREIRERQRVKQEICFSLDNYILPFIEGIADSFGEPLIPGIKRLITENKNPFRPREDWNRTQETQTAIGNFVKNPVTSRLWFIAKPILKKKIDPFLNETDWVINTILKDEYPDIYSVITETEGGVEWFKTFIQDLATTLKPIAK